MTLNKPTIDAICNFWTEEFARLIMEIMEIMEIS